MWPLGASDSSKKALGVPKETQKDPYMIQNNFEEPHVI